MASTRFLLTLTCCLLCAGTATQQAAAQGKNHPARYTGYTESSDVNSRLASDGSHAGGCGSGSDSCGACGCGDACDCCCYEGCGGGYAAIELLFLKPHFDYGIDSAGLLDGDRSNSFSFRQFDPDYDVSESLRFTLGYVDCEGLGARVRWFEFDDDANTLTTIPGPGNRPSEFQRINASLEVEAWDFEITQAVRWCVLEATFAGGVRFATVETTRTRVENDNGDFRNTLIEFEGWGPTVALDLRRPLGCGPWALVAGTRASLLFGETDMSFANGLGRLGFPTPPLDDEEALGQLVEDDDVVWVMELQLGLEYRQCVSCGGTLSLRAVMEAQHWGNAVVGGTLVGQSLPSVGGPETADAVATGDGSLGLFGFAFGAAYEF